MDYPAERNAPDIVTRQHLGAEVLYRLPNQAIVSSGKVSGLSPEGIYFQVDEKHWLHNTQGKVLAVLPKATKRVTPYES